MIVDLHQKHVQSMIYFFYRKMNDTYLVRLFFVCFIFLLYIFCLCVCVCVFRWTGGAWTRHNGPEEKIYRAAAVVDESSSVCVLCSSGTLS